MKFVMSYSCGKDSTLALHKMKEEGHTPVGLLVMFNDRVKRSYFHGADRSLLERYSDALGIPLILCPTTGEDYDSVLEEGLRKAVSMGAEAACFGDIDLEGNRQWEEDRCAHAGISAVFPLWQTDRKENVRQVLEAGYRCIIKTVNRNLLPESLLGKMLDEESVRIMKERGIDVCGENGEYHTLAVDGPVFRHPLEYRLGEVIGLGDYPVINVI